MSKKKKDKNWQTKKFLLQHQEDFHTKPTEFFHNGSWFIFQGGLTEIKGKMSEPEIKYKKEKRKLCLLCEEQEFDVLSYKVEEWEDHTKYYSRDQVLILPSVDYLMHYYEIEIPFSKQKEKAIIKNIERNIPADISERSGYYFDQVSELDGLRNRRRRCGGHFLLCPRHSNKTGIKKALNKMVETSYNWEREHMNTLCQYFLIRFPMSDIFLTMHYSVEEIIIRVVSTEKLEKMIRDYAYLPGDFS